MHIEDYLENNFSNYHIFVIEQWLFGSDHCPVATIFSLPKWTALGWTQMENTLAEHGVSPITPSNSLSSWEAKSLSFDPIVYPRNRSIVQVRDNLIRSYQPIVLASLWSSLWSPTANERETSKHIAGISNEQLAVLPLCHIMPMYNKSTTHATYIFNLFTQK